MLIGREAVECFYGEGLAGGSTPARFGLLIKGRDTGGTGMSLGTCEHAARSHAAKELVSGTTGPGFHGVKDNKKEEKVSRQWGDMHH